jgi:GNAT superfamily N-acetyltransferase
VEAFELRNYGAGDCQRAVDLLQSAFRGWPGPRVAARDRPEELFRWKHERNPRGESFIVLAEAEGRLAVLRAYMAWPWALGGNRVRAVHTVDIATHPDFRGQGLSSKLSEWRIARLRETTGFSLGLPNDMSRSLSHKVGWQPVAKLHVWVRVRRPLRVLHRARSLKAPGNPLAVPSVERARWPTVWPTGRRSPSCFATRPPAPLS